MSACIILSVIIITIVMFRNRKCTHPHNQLVVYSDSTIEEIPHPSGNNHTNITHHLMCHKCNEHLDVGYAKMGVL